VKDRFYVKRASDGASVLYARGFSDDIGDTPATIVLTVRMGARPRTVRQQLQTVADRLNEAWHAEYERPTVVRRTRRILENHRPAAEP
jgi:hypothetical protein